jgi:uncharacterized membrane protein
MTTPLPTPAPTEALAPPGKSPAVPDVARSDTGRLDGVDAARGVALIGMMVIHVLPDADPATGYPAWTYSICAGNASALFALLAGVSIAFATGRARVGRERATATVAALGARAAVIAVVGLALGYTDAELAAVILPYYAAMFVFAIPLVFLPTWGVAVAGVTVVAGAPALTHLLLPHLTEPGGTNAGFGDVVSRPLALLGELVFTGEFPALTWMAYVCFGVIIGRLRLSSAGTAARLLIVGGCTAVLAHVASELLLYRYGGLQHIWSAANTVTTDDTMELLSFGGDGTVPATTWWWLATDEPHTGTPFDLLASTGVAAAVLAVMLLADHQRRPFARRLTGLARIPLAAAGTMTLTFYTLHVMFINSIHDTYAPTTDFVLQTAVVAVLGMAWQASAGRGPLEAVTATVTRRARRVATRRADKSPRHPTTDAGKVSL